MQRTDDRLTMFNVIAAVAKPMGAQPRNRACSSKDKEGSKPEEDSQAPRAASCPHSRKLWAERVDRLLREDPDKLPYEPTSSKEILPLPDLEDDLEKHSLNLKELADKVQASGKTPINYCTGDMPLYSAAGTPVARPPPGSSPLEHLTFFQDHIWNLPALPTRPLPGDSAASTHSTAAKHCPSEEMALTDQESHGSALPRLCRSTTGLGAAALLPQTAASLAPAPSDTRRAAGAAPTAAAPSADDMPAVIVKTATTVASAHIIRAHILAIAASHGDAVICPDAAWHARKLLSEGETFSSHLATMQLIISRGPRTLIASLASSRTYMYICFNMRAGCPAQKTPDGMIALSVQAGTLSLPSPYESAQAIDATPAPEPDATVALLHPSQTISSGPAGVQWWTSVHRWAQTSCLRFIHLMQKVMKKAAAAHPGRGILTALQIQPAATALEHAPGQLTPVRRHGGRSAAGLRVAGIIRRDIFSIMALIGDCSVSPDIVGAMRCQLERGATRSAHLALTRFLVAQGRRMALTSSGCLHSMAAASSQMPAWPAPAPAARLGRLPLLLWTLTLDRPLVTHTELHWLTTQPAAEQNTLHTETPAADPLPGVAMAAKAVCLGLAAAERASALMAGRRGAKAFRALLPMAYRLAGAAAGAGDCVRHILHS